jgi:O-antigen/teichoic acid export membrane protein
MSKAADIGKVSAKGGFHLLWGLIASTIISSVGTLFIAGLLSPDQYGLYSIVLTAPALISIFRDWGVTSAMTRYSAQYRAENRNAEIRSIFISGIIFEITLGLALTIASFFIAGFLSNSVFNRPEIASLIQIASFIILAGGLTNAATAVFTGMDRMELNSVILIFQSIIKTALVIVLVALGLGTSGATIGFTTATIMAGLIGTLAIWIIYKKLPKPDTHKLEIKAYMTEMFKYGLPLSIAGIIGGFLTQFYTFLLPIYYSTDNAIIGNYRIAVNFVVLIGFFATPIATMLFPAFSKLDPQKDKEALKNVFQYSIKYASLLVVPVAALVMCLSGPAVSTLFGNKYASAPLFLALLAITYTYTALGSLSAGNLINSQGQTTLMLKLSIIDVSIGFPMGYLLIMNFGVLGLIITASTAGLPSYFLLLYWIKKRYSVTVEWHSSAKILLSSAIAALSTYAFVGLLGFTASWIQLTVGVVFFFAIFVLVALMTRTLEMSDISNLHEMTSNLGFVGKLSDTLLNLLERIMHALKLK